MLADLSKRFSILLNSGDERTRNVKKNILFSVVIKGGSILLTLVLVPLTIHYINAERYGIWLTISAVITWFNFFDLGLGNGLRNRLVAALAEQDLVKARSLISTAYASLGLIALLLSFLFYGINSQISWSSLLGVPASYDHELLQLVNLLSVLFCVQFVLQLINTIFFAFQKPALVSAIFFAGNLLSCVFIFALKQAGMVSLVWLGLAFFSGMLVSLAAFSGYFFLFSRPDLAPRIRLATMADTKQLFKLGSSFFIIQIAAIMQYQTANILISHYMTPTDVTEYNIAFRLFSVISMAFNILITPIWSASTDAHVKKDFAWFQSIEKNLRLTWYWACGLVLVILLASAPLYKIWVGDTVHVSFYTSLGVALYIISFTFSMIYVNILNGMGKVKVQLYLSVLTIICFVPLAWLFSSYLGMGLFGISLALIVSNFNGILAAPIQFRRVLKQQLG